MTDQFNALIQKYASLHDIPWRLVYYQIEQESSGDARAKSSVGACGLLQLMPASFPELSEQEIFDPEINIKTGVAFLRHCIDIFQKEQLDERSKFGLAAYNAGPGNIIKAQELTQHKGFRSDIWIFCIPALVSVTGYANAMQTDTYVRNIWTNFRTDKSSS